MEKNKNIKLTSDELSELVMLNNEYQDVLIKLGQLSLRKKQLNTEQDSIKKNEEECLTLYNELEKTESNFKERIVRKYGEGSLDINAGTYILSKK